MITREGTQLISQGSGQGRLSVYAEAKDAFFAKLIPATLQFLREDGKVTGMKLKQGGRELKAQKTQ